MSSRTGVANEVDEAAPLVVVPPGMACDRDLSLVHPHGDAEVGARPLCESDVVEVAVRQDDGVDVGRRAVQLRERAME